MEEGRVLIGGDPLLSALSLLPLEAEAEAVTGCLGHGRFALFSLVTGINPTQSDWEWAPPARAFADADG